MAGQIDAGDNPGRIGVAPIVEYGVFDIGGGGSMVEMGWVLSGQGGRNLRGSRRNVRKYGEIEVGGKGRFGLKNYYLVNLNEGCFT